MKTRFTRCAACCSATLMVAACFLLSGCNEATWIPVTTATPARAATPVLTPVSNAAQSAVAVAPVEPVVDTPKAPSEPLPTINITYDALKFDIEKDQLFKRSMLTEKIEALDGRTITVRGYILPPNIQSGLTQLILMRDNQECCFGPGAYIYDCVIVEMKPGRSTDYTTRPVAVTGVFNIREMVDGEGNVVAIYHLDGDAVE